MSEEQEIARLTEPVHYDNAEMCIAGAINAAKKNGGKDISVKAKFENWLEVEFWIPNEEKAEKDVVPDKLPWE